MKIFVSYSRRDAGDFAEQIYEHLREQHDIFTDVNNIQVGSVWSNEIENNISNCDLFVAIITHAALRSTEVETEVLQAQRENKIIIPCFHRDVSENEIKWNLSKIQGIEFDERYELARKLYSKVKKIPIKKDSEIYLTDAHEWYNKGLILGNLGRYSEAVACYDKSLAIDPNNALTWYNKGLSMIKLGKNKDGEKCFDVSRNLSNRL